MWKARVGCGLSTNGLGKAIGLPSAKGVRREWMPSQAVDGRLVFTASVSGAETARICYEITAP